MLLIILYLGSVYLTRRMIMELQAGYPVKIVDVLICIIPLLNTVYICLELITRLLKINRIDDKIARLFFQRRR